LIDIGRLSKENNAHKTLLSITRGLKEWLEKECPDLVEYYQHEIDKWE